MNEKIRGLFPATNNYTYLNSAAVAPLPTTAVDAVISQLRDVSENGSANYTDWIATKNRARQLVASMLNVRAEQIAFMRNTSDGFATVANGLRWQSGDNIVSFEKEFPGNKPRPGDPFFWPTAGLAASHFIGHGTHLSVPIVPVVLGRFFGLARPATEVANPHVARCLGLHHPLRRAVPGCRRCFDFLL